MAYCSNCGKQIEKDARFCSSCGAAQSSRQSYAEAEPVGNTAEVSGNDRIMGILSYLSILVLVPIFSAKKSAFVRFHIKQGLLLNIGAITLILLRVLIRAVVFFRTYSVLRSLLVLPLNLGLLGLTIYMVIGIIRAVRGEKKPLPFIGKYKIFH